MKHIKKLLAALLSLVLLLGLMISAFAEGEYDKLYVPWEDVTITYPRASFDEHYLVAYGEGFTLSIEAALPDDVEISYQWWYSPGGGDNVPIEGETGSQFSSNPGDSYYPNPSMTSKPYADKPFSRQIGFYVCAITLEKKDANGTVIDTYTTTTSTLTVEVGAEREMNFWEKIWYNGIVAGWTISLTVGMLTVGFGFLAFPVIFPVMTIISLLSGGIFVY